MKKKKSLPVNHVCFGENVVGSTSVSEGTGKNRKFPGNIPEQ